MTILHREATITVLKEGYTGIVGTIPDPISAAVTWQWQGVGTATLVVREQGEAASELLKARDKVVPVTVKMTGYPRWSGWVQRAESVRTSGQIGVITANVVSERRWLDRILAAPTPGSPWSSQTSAHDTRTGPLATIARQFVTANVARINALAPPVPDLPIVVTNVIPPDTSPVLTIQARNKSIAEEIGPSLLANGYDVTVNLWLPGDPAPAVTPALTQPAMVVDVVKGRNQQYVNFSDEVGGLAKRTVAVVHPGATATLVGGPGEEAARVFNYVVADDGRVESLGKWGYSEDFLDAVDADDPAVRIQRGKDHLVEQSGKVAFTAELDDRQPWKAGPADYDGDYWIGDTVRATFNGVTTSDRIDRLTVSVNSTDGFKVIPQFGETRATESPDLQLARIVRQLQQEIAALKAGR